MFSYLPSRKHVAWSLLCLCVILLTACGGATSAPTSGSRNIDNNQAGSLGHSRPGGPRALTVQMPSTRTDCPQPALSGRAPVTRALGLGNDPSVVYINDQGTTVGPGSFGELKLYDTVMGAPTAGSKTMGGKRVIVHLPEAIITEAQVSSDGQWVLFVVLSPDASKIQLVRMDGQGLQTLYCAPPGTVQSVQWSPDDTRFIFSQEAVSGLWNLYLFNMLTGQVQPELVQSNSTALGYEARTWFDDHRVYVVGVINPASPAPPRGLFALDTTKGPDQQPSDLIQIIKPSQPQYCWAFDSDYNTTVLLTSQCHQTFPANAGDIGVLSGPSSIVAQGVTGGPKRTVYADRQAISQVRMLGHSSGTLLMMINNFNPTDFANPGSAQNGVWKINLDGSDLTNLASADGFSECEFNQFSQYPWANVSLDNRLYSFEEHQIEGKDDAITLVVGMLNGGPLNTVSFEEGSANLGNLAIAGWTSM